MKQAFNTTLVFILLIAGIVGVVWGMTSLPSPLVALIGGGVGFLVSRMVEAWKENQGRLYEGKREVYARLINPWRDHLISASQTGATEPTPEMLKTMAEASFDTMLYGSDDVIKRYGAFRNEWENSMQNNRLLQLGSLLKSMRKDLGYTYTTVDEVDLLAMIVNMTIDEKNKLKAELAQRRSQQKVARLVPNPVVKQ